VSVPLVVSGSGSIGFYPAAFRRDKTRSSPFRRRGSPKR
jgi:hypothetical protein